jgi:hypothetical protein
VREADLIHPHAADGIVGRDEVVEQHAEAVEVGGRRAAIAEQHLRRHVDRRAEHLRAAVRGGAELTAGAEVHQHDPAAVLAHHVAGFQVAVDEAKSMHRRERIAERHADERGLVRAERPILGHQHRQRPPLDVLHRQADIAADALRAVDRDDVRVAHAGHQLPLAEHRVFGDAVQTMDVDDLERDVPLECRVPGAMHDAEAAPAQLLEQHETAPRRARPRRVARVRRRRRDGMFGREIRRERRRRGERRGLGRVERRAFVEIDQRLDLLLEVGIAVARFRKPVGTLTCREAQRQLEYLPDASGLVRAHARPPSAQSNPLSGEAIGRPR